MLSSSNGKNLKIVEPEIRGPETEPSQRRRHEKWLIALLVLMLSVTAAAARTKTKKKVAEIKEEEPPYKAYIVAEATTGKVLEGQNIHLRWPPASITKLMVAFIALEKISTNELHLDDRIRVSREASMMGGSQVFLKEGETFTLEELMKAMMVVSANDAACAIAEFIAGSKEKFVYLMNEKAKSLGMQDTIYHSVHGLPPSRDQQEDLTSCYDLAILSRAILRYPKILDWTSIKNDTFRHGTFELDNHNKLLSKMRGVDGLKTGYYRRAGYNVVATAERKNLRLIIVVLGSPTAKARDAVVMKKLNTYFSLYEMAQVVKKGEVIGHEILLPQGETPKLRGIAGSGFSYPVVSKNKNALTKEIELPEQIEGEIKKNEKLGEVVIKLGNHEVGRVDILSPKAVPRAGSFTVFRRKLGMGN
jgi:D-alanyl-D-alanine carboxypeptidase (penicillin-binding protein 5/6)